MTSTNLLLELKPTLCNTCRICEEQFLSYLPFLTEEPNGANEWIVSPFSMDCISKAKITDDFKENLFDMKTDCRFQTIFKEIARIVKGTVLPMHEVQLYGFPTIWINTCVNKAFLAVAFIKTGDRNCLQLKLDMMHAVSIVPPRIEKLVL